MNLRLKNGFPYMSDSTLERSSFRILSAMKLNTKFPNPVPDMETMELLVSEFTFALNDCKTGDRTKIAEKNEKRKALIEGLGRLRIYVLLESDNNRAVASTSGFTIVPDRTPRLPLEKPLPPELSNGLNSGEMVIKGKRVANATSYVFHVANLEGMTSDQWQTIHSSKTKVMIPNLTRGVLYYCRMGAVGSNEQLVFSDIIAHTPA